METIFNLITSSTPATWQDLQNRVAEILSDCGFAVEIEKKAETVRGDVEIDVYAEEDVRGRKYVIICECKYWKTRRIPQTNVHAFRSVVSDLGVNIGYIISLKGFQSGAFKSSRFTNVELVSWEEFQQRFFHSWYEEHFAPEMAKQLDGALTYSEPVIVKWARWLDVMSEEDKRSFLVLKEKYDLFGWLMMAYTPYVRAFAKNKESITALPLVDQVSQQPEHQKELLEKIPHDILFERGYREFLQRASTFGKVVENDYQHLKDKYGWEM